MNTQSQQDAVLKKLNQVGVVEPCCLKSNCNGWVWIKSQKPIDWEYQGLQVCHEAEKLLAKEKVISGRTPYVRYRRYLIQHCGNNYNNAIFATYEQRLLALCRVWFPERF